MRKVLSLLLWECVSGRRRGSIAEADTAQASIYNRSGQLFGLSLASSGQLFNIFLA